LREAGSGTELVFQYVQQREEPTSASGQDSIETLQQRIRQLEEQLAKTTSFCDQLKEVIRELQSGFRKHRSEVIVPEQLQLALGRCTQQTEAASEPDSPCDGGPTLPGADPCSPSPEPESGSTGNAPKNRSRHGRRRIQVLPRIIEVVYPTEVLLHGICAFEQIGQEDSSVIGFRRGGPFELVIRRLKFVLKNSAGGTPQESAPDVAMALCSQQPTDAAPAESTQSPEPSADYVEFSQHDALCVPADPTFSKSPFVDGALVRFFADTDSRDDAERTVFIAPAVPRPIERALADPGLLAHLFADKFVRHIPYYRQEKELGQFGWPVPRANMSRWQFECGQLVQPLVKGMWEQALARSWFAMDATGTAIRGSPKYEYHHIFVLVAEAESILFRVTPTYDGDTVQKLFGTSGATILADASANHNVLFKDGHNREASCWAHARRRFVQAFRAGEGAECTGVLQTMQTLFRIEREIAAMSPADKVRERQARSAPLVKELLDKARVRRDELGPESLTRKGFVYLDNQRVSLSEFLVNGEIPMHNNVSERELRRAVKGRINWLFHGSEQHAESAAAIMSLVASAELHSLDPELYLQELLTVIGEYPKKRVMDLAPENWGKTRRALIEAGQLKYIDLARVTGSRLAFRAPQAGNDGVQQR